MASILRIPLSVFVIWSVHTTMTAPQPPPQLDERVGPKGLEVYILPPLVKLCFWTAGLAEIIVTFTQIIPPNSLSKYVSNFLVHPAMTPDNIQITLVFLFAWICSISGALIRRSCYRNMGEMFTFELSLRKNHKLITSGPYSFVRHPSYTSGAMALLGALMCHITTGSWVMECSGIFQSSWANIMILICWLFAGIVGFLVIAPRLDKEDDILRKRFGAEWDAWAQRVPFRLIPGLY